MRDLPLPSAQDLHLFRTIGFLIMSSVWVFVFQHRTRWYFLIRKIMHAVRKAASECIREKEQSQEHRGEPCRPSGVHPPRTPAHKYACAFLLFINVSSLAFSIR